MYVGSDEDYIFKGEFIKVPYCMKIEKTVSYQLQTIGLYLGYKRLQKHSERIFKLIQRAWQQKFSICFARSVCLYQVCTAALDLLHIFAVLK